MIRRVTHALTRTQTADKLRGLALRIIGISAAVQAGFTVGDTAGWATLAAGVLIFEWSIEDED